MSISFGMDMIIGMDNDPFRNVCWFKIQKLQFGKIIFRQFFRNSISIEKRIRNWKFTEREREREIYLSDLIIHERG